MNLKIRRLVKNNIKQTLHVFAGILFLGVIFAACNDSNDLGFEILPSEDLINVKSVVVKDDISAFTFSETGLISSGGTSMLGSFNDPDFGSTHVNFAAQFRLSSFPQYGTNAVADSIKLYLYYRSVYGDTLTAQNLKVYELESSLDPDKDYTQDIDLKSMSYDQLLGEINYKPIVELDSATQDTLYQLISIPIDIALGQKLISADSTDMISNDAFLEYFKGLYVEAKTISGQVGSLLTLDASSSSSFQGSALVLYYNNDENIAKELDPEEEPDTLSRAFIITPNSARVNSIEHDYTGTVFIDNIDQEVIQDQNIYVQPTGGLKSKILIDGLETWRDSVVIRGTDTIKYAINRAEIIFQVDTVTTDKDMYAPPPQLLLTFIDDEGEERLPTDYFFNPGFYGGYMYEGYVYRFNITQHLQRIINGDVGNNGFYLSTGRRSYYANRVVLESPLKGSGIQLKITYSTFLE
jgi:hypothetical protein